MKTVGERLREERVRLGYSQTDFGVRAGVQKLAQLNYEKGARSPDTEYLASIAAAGADVLYIITGERRSTAPGSFHADVLRQVIEGVEEALRRKRMKLAAGKKADLVVVLYEHHSKTGEPVEVATIERFLRLVA